MAALRFKVDGKELALEPTLNLLQDADASEAQGRGRGAGQDLQGEPARSSRSITNTLAKDKEISDRWRGFKDVADARHLSNRVEPEVVDALVAAVRDAYPRLSHRYYALKARWFGKKQLPHWDRNAPLPKVEHAHRSRWDEARDTVLTAYGAFSPKHGGRSPSASSTSAGSTRRRGRARRRAPSRIRPCRRRTPTCCSTTRASRAT